MTPRTAHSVPTPASRFSPVGPAPTPLAAPTSRGVQPSDEDLFDRYRQHGDMAAFEQLVQRHGRSVLNFACRFLGERGRSDDILQDVFLRVIRGAAGFRSQCKFTTWLYRITRNVCTDLLRKRARPAPLSLDGSGILGDSTSAGGVTRPLPPATRRHLARRRVSMSGMNARRGSSGLADLATPPDGVRPVDTIPDSSRPDVDLSARHSEALDLVEVAIAEIPPEQREVLLLREKVGLSFLEISQIVNAPVNTVKSRMRYSLENLRRALLRSRGGAAILKDGV